MSLFKTLGLMAMSFGLLLGQTPAEDPVMKARTQRAQAQGTNEGDLPPVPKGIIEPPPLPPPELHVRDMVRSTRATARASKVSDRKAGRRERKGRGKAVKAKTERRAGARERVALPKPKAQKAKAAPKASRTAPKRGRRR